MIRLKSVAKSWAKTTAVREASLEIPAGAYLAVVGGSGCGKTTLLRMIAGFEQPDAGEIWMGSRQTNCPHMPLHPYQRGIGMVFQNLALWPHLTVEEHMKYVLSSRIPRRALPDEIEQRLEWVSLKSKASAYPSQLSGGEQQRLSLARAVACARDLLLLDEPMNSLDRRSRDELSSKLRGLHARMNLTVIHVTHDWRDVRGLADRVVEMENGAFIRDLAAETYFTERREEETWQ